MELTKNRSTKDLFKSVYIKPESDHKLDVRKSSIQSLFRWAHSRQMGALKEFKGQDRDYQAMYWDGYKKAIEEILEMENQ